MGGPNVNILLAKVSGEILGLYFNPISKHNYLHKEDPAIYLHRRVCLNICTNGQNYETVLKHHVAEVPQ